MQPFTVSKRVQILNQSKPKVEWSQSYKHTQLPALTRARVRCVRGWYQRVGNHHAHTYLFACRPVFGKNTLARMLAKVDRRVSRGNLDSCI